MHDQLDIPDRPSYRVARATRMDPNTKRLALIAGGIAAVLILLVGAYSVIGHRPRGVPVIEADSRPVRVKPANPGGLEVSGGDDAILSGIDDGQQGTAPPPETPAPQALQAAEAKAHAQADAARLAAAAPPAPLPATQAIERALVPQPAQPASLSSPAAAAAPSPAALSAMPEQRPAPPRLAAKPAVPTAPQPAAAAMQVQLAALASEEGAMTEWQRLSHKMPDLLAARHPAVSRSERDGKTFYRLRTGGFSDVAQATQFCERVKAKGGGCSVASF